ncbi:Mannose-6-phosphate isomerase [Gracilaria domingensis]|nr:Mannose-6-phosphate isomerase [Gracilaria domingensis]
MCNFRPVEEILAHLDAHSDLSDLCDGQSFKATVSGTSNPAEKKAALRHLFSTLMNASDDAVSTALDAVVEKLKMHASGTNASRTDADKLFLQLVSYYPGDVGCFAAYLLNYVQIEPGQAFFMAANEPHAYLLGQCVEIMACSDNVVRAGLTPKFKDVSTLIDMLTYQDAYPEIMNGTPLDEYSKLYQPPVEEFQLIKCALPSGTKYKLPPLRGPSIIMCLDGSGWICLSSTVSEARHELHPLGPGRIYYVEDSASLVVEAKGSAVAGAPSPDLVFFRASANQSKLVLASADN